ncbi:SBBP repeat-containing protein [Spirochaetota bacterium]
MKHLNILVFLAAVFISAGIGCKDSSGSSIPKGVPDTSFGDNGILVDNITTGGNTTDMGYSMFLDNSSNIYVTGERHNGTNSDMIIWKFNSDGIPDQSFGNNGVVVDDNAAGGSDFDVGFSIFVDNSGNIYVAGVSKNASGNSDMVIWKYSNNGMLDDTFGDNGIVSHDNAANGSSGYDYGRSIFVDNNGSVYVSGESNGVSGNTDMVIWKYTGAGILDDTFGDNGIVVDDNAAGGGGDDFGQSITVDNSGNIFVAGTSYGKFYNDDMAIWKYNSDGTPHSFFGDNGTVIYNFSEAPDSEDWGESIFIDGTGNIYVAGQSYTGATYDMAIWKYNADGIPDSTFGTDGVVFDDNAAGGGNADMGNSVFVDSEGRVYVAGNSDSQLNREDMTIWRYTANGILDTSFGNNGIVVENNAAGGNHVDNGFSIFVNRGKVYVTGYSINADINSDMVIWKYK